jgi:hypothetical protein
LLTYGDRSPHGLNELDSDVSFWRPRAFFGHISVAGLGAVISVIAGFNSKDWVTPWWVPEKQNWVLVFGALITVISAWQAFYGHRDRWLSYAAAAERLRALLARVDFQSSVPTSTEPDRAQKLFDEFAGVLSELNRIEMATLQKDKKKSQEKDQ